MSFKLQDLLHFLYKIFPKGKIQTMATHLVRKQVRQVLMPPQPIAVELINQFFASLQIPDPKQREAALVPLVHRSLLYNGKAGPELGRNVKEFALKRALREFHLYAHPVQVKEVHCGSRIAIGTRETGERGRVDKYFIAKRPGVEGLPAPIDVFFPESGGAPKLSGFGSL